MSRRGKFCARPWKIEFCTGLGKKTNIDSFPMLSKNVQNIAQCFYIEESFW